MAGAEPICGDIASLPPHSSHSGANIHFGPLTGRSRCATGRPSRLLKQSEQLFGNESRPCCIEVTIALRVLTVDEETLPDGDRPLPWS